MKYLILLLFSLFVSCVHSASANWIYVNATSGGVWGAPSLSTYDLSGRIRDDVASCSTEGHLLGYTDNSTFYLKQVGFTGPVDDQGPGYVVPSEDNNILFLSYYGDLLNDVAVEAARQLPLVDWHDTECSGGVRVEDPSNFYLGFIATGSFTSDGLDRFGWYHLSVDDNMQMSILDVGIGFYGEAVVVGIGPIPEPSCVLLVLIGCALLSLRRGDRHCRSMSKGFSG